MADRERRMTPPFGGVFVASARVMTRDDMRRATRRMAHEVIERNQGSEDILVVGLQTGGVKVAKSLVNALEEIEERRIEYGCLDVALHRDDIGLRPVVPEAVTKLPDRIDSKIVVIVDDVLFTGRTIRASLDAICHFGRPRSIQLAVMVDRGHRELPIRPDYVGKNLPTRIDEVVDVSEKGVDLGVMRK